MCILVRGESNDQSWHGYRSVETIAFHRAPQRRVAILFMVLLENHKPDNYLRVLHPGNSTCKVTSPWIGDGVLGGLAYHPEENDKESGSSILHQIYGNMFKHGGDGRLYQVQTLNPYESWYGLDKPKMVTVWPDDEGGLRIPADIKKEGVEPITIDPQVQGDEFVPFTIWRLGPFKSTGLILASFNISFEGATYDALVGEREYFSVDGPRRLRGKTRYDGIRRMPVMKQATWERHLESFDSYVDFTSSYDVIVRACREADGSRIEIDEAGSCMVAKAADDRQPRDKEAATRYVTMESDFKLNLHYVYEARETGKEPPSSLVRQPNLA